MTIQPQKLWQDYQSMPTLLQSLLYENSGERVYQVANWMASWWPSYGALLNARAERRIHFFASKSCLFDHTKDKVAAVSGNCPTIRGRLIAYERFQRAFVIKDDLDTAYFEVFNEHPFTLIQHFKDPEKPPLCWDVYNKLIPAYENQEEQRCLEATCSKLPSIQEDWVILPLIATQLVYEKIFSPLP